MNAGHLVRAIGIAAMLAGFCSAQNNAIPLLYQPLLPTSKAPGSKAFALTVNGTGFASTAVVNWNGSPRLTEVISSRQVKASISAADVASAKTVWITVTNPAPGGGTSNVVFFPVTRPTTSIAMAIRQPFPGATVVEVGDFNNDGKLDIVWMGPQGLNVSLGNGNGSFQAPIVTATFSFDALATGDFNGDGKLDVAGADGSGFVELLLGNGDGTFTEGWQYLPGIGGGNYATAADFGQSGSLDVYHTGFDLGQQWFEILHAGNQGPLYYTSYSPGPASVGDFNGDGMLDLAIFENGGSYQTVDIWLNTALNGFQEFGSFNGGRPPFGVADMNQDGKLDLVNGCIWLGGGDGTFKAGGCPSGGSGFAGFGDFNGDGKLDTAVDANSGGIMIALGAGDGTYKGGFSFPFPPFDGGGAVGDFNNDGKLDVVTSDGYLLLQTTVGLTPYSLSFGSQNVGTKSATQAATLTNVGAAALVINEIFFTGSAPGQFSQTNDCGLGLAAGSSCTISVTFAPTRAGSLGAALAVSYKGTASPQTVAVNGTGVAPPTVKLQPSILTFATQLVGTTSTAQTVNLSNPGTAPVAISNIAAHGAFSQTNNCPATLVNASCQIQVVFKPKAAGTAQGSLSVTDSAKGGTQWVNMSGTGTVITVSPAGVNFGNQKVGTKSATAPITLTNVGANAVSVSQVTIAGTNAGDFAQTNNCGTSLAAHGSCTIDVTFKPTATGARSASVSITDNGGASPQSVALAGTGS